MLIFLLWCGRERSEETLRMESDSGAENLSGPEIFRCFNGGTIEVPYISCFSKSSQSVVTVYCLAQSHKENEGENEEEDFRFRMSHECGNNRAGFWLRPCFRGYSRDHGCVRLSMMWCLMTWRKSSRSQKLPPHGPFELTLCAVGFNISICPWVYPALYSILIPLFSPHFFCFSPSLSIQTFLSEASILYLWIQLQQPRCVSKKVDAGRLWTKWKKWNKHGV